MINDLGVDTPHISAVIVKALEFASVAHKNQRRKTEDEVPYISHPASVGLLLAHHHFPEPVIIAGILHDVIEDTQFGYSDIETRFGKEVADLVQHVTEDKAAPWLQRKQGYTDHLNNAPDEALIISATDSLSNMRSMKAGLEKQHADNTKLIFNMAKQMLTYVPQRYEIISKRIKHKLVEEWHEAILELQETLKNNG